MSVWTKIRDQIEAFFSGPVWAFVKPLVSVLETGAGHILIAAAENAVVAGYNAKGTGNAKMSVALTTFEQEIVSQGIPYLESQARTLIELAYQRFEAPLHEITTPTAELTSGPVPEITLASALVPEIIAEPDPEAVVEEVPPGAGKPLSPLEAARTKLQATVNTVS